MSHFFTFPDLVFEYNVANPITTLHLVFLSGLKNKNILYKTMDKPSRTLPNELLAMIAEYVYSSQKHSNFYRLSKTTKNIMDSLAKKAGFSDYLSRCLILSNVCYDCRGLNCSRLNL
jgi:hypothetical protein